MRGRPSPPVDLAPRSLLSRPASRGILLALALAAAVGCPGRSKRPPLEFSPASLPKGRVGVAYEAEVRAQNAETPVIGFRIAGGSLPPGLSLERVEDGVRIVGTPARAGTYSVTLSASCYGTQVSGQTGEKPYEIVVREKD